MGGGGRGLQMQTGQDGLTDDGAEREGCDANNRQERENGAWAWCVQAGQPFSSSEPVGTLDSFGSGWITLVACGSGQVRPVSGDGNGGEGRVGGGQEVEWDGKEQGR